ncbi:MAG: AI-2E family transporter [Paenibacillaceae bacterium ZCTH02-B3]|nr:MAG: AI-2E family transporter [Paenibacillaceae bacterium ZCTH02-B3]
MIEWYKKYWRTAFDIAVLAFTVWLVMYVFSFLYRIAAPVFLSFLVFLIIEPPARRLHRLGMRKSVASAVSTLMFILVILAVLVGIGYIFAWQIGELQKSLPGIQATVQEKAASLTAVLQERLETLDPALTDKVNEAIAYVTALFSRLAATFLNWFVSLFSSLSTFIVQFVIAIVLAYFLSVEIDSWKKIASERSPKSLQRAFAFLREHVFRGIAAYLKAQATLIGITFAIILAVLSALGIPNALAIAVIAGILDVLPLLGIGTLFVPWIGYLFLTGETSLALWLTGLFVVVSGVRQILEPRITGQKIGVSAFTMLSFMIISLSLFGVVGLVLAPVLVILLKACYEHGYLHRWIRFPKEDFAVSPFQPTDASASGNGDARRE